jgi:hypothetical protein
MQRLHSVVAAYAHSLRAHEEICFWQDSVLLLGHVNKDPESYERVMSDVVRLKKQVGAEHVCHAVCVKGKSLPPPNIRPKRTTPRVLYLSASSLAFSNAFQIEHELGRHAADWYIDVRIVNKCRFRPADLTEGVRLLPGNSTRKVHLYFGSPRPSRGVAARNVRGG